MASSSDDDLIDIEGHRLDPQISAALERRCVEADIVKVLGPYPKLVEADGR